MNIQLKDVDNVVFNGIDVSAVKFNDVLVWRKWETVEYTGAVPVEIIAAGEPLIDYLISGNMSQTGTPSSQSIIMPQECGEKTENLFDVSTVVSGTVIGQHMAMSYGSVKASSVTLASDYISVNPAEQYVFSCENYDPANMNGRGYAFYDSNKNVISSDVDTLYDVRVKVSLSITTPSNASYVRISYDKNATKLMLNSGSTPLPYSPYGYKLDISSGGEQLFDYTDRTEIINGSYINQNGSIVENVGYYISYPIEVEAGATYTWRFNSEDVTTLHSAPTVGYYDSNNTLIGTARHSNNVRFFSFTIPSNCEYIRCSVYQRNGAQSEAMLNLGSTAKPYSPYNRTTTPIYLGEVETERRVKKLVLTGQETFTYYNTKSGKNVMNLSVPDSLGVTLGNELVFCTHLPRCKQSEIYGETVERGISTRPSSQILFYDTAIANTPAGFKSYLQQQYANGTPVTVWYVLATPTTGIVNEPLRKIGDYADTISAEQAGVSIPTVEGSNVIDVLTTLKPSEVYIKYKGKST